MRRMISSCWRTGTGHVPVCFTRHLSPTKQKLKELGSGSKHCEPRAKAKTHSLWEGEEAIATAPGGEPGNLLLPEHRKRLSTTGEGEKKSPPTLECGSYWEKKQKTPNKTNKDTKSSLTAVRRRGKDYVGAPPMRIRHSRPSEDSSRTHMTESCPISIMSLTQPP